MPGSGRADRRGVRTVGRPSRKDKLVVPDYAEGLQLKIDELSQRLAAASTVAIAVIACLGWLLGRPLLETLTALARGLAILRSFHVDEQLLANADIAERTRIPKPTVSRLTYTLTQLGYLRYREEFGKYEVAASVVGLAYPYISKQVVPAIARPLMLELAEQTQTNVGLGVYEGLSVLYLEYAPGDIKSSRRQRVGFRVPLVRTAMGRGCVAAMGPEQRKDVLERIQQYYPEEWPDLWKQMEEAILHEQKYGYCVSVGTFNRFTNAVSVPFSQPDSPNIMAFNSQGPSELLTPTRMARIGKQLMELADQVRAQMASASAPPSAASALARRKKR